MNRVDRLSGRKVGIIGMARSGLAAAELVHQLDGQPFVSDILPEDKLHEAIARLERNQILFECGGHSDRLLDMDYMVISPGVPSNLEIILKISEVGIPVFSEIELAYWVCRGQILAVTGSNGKTTTASLLGEICQASGRPTVVAGNIGRPFAEVTRAVPDDGLVVLEVSSFQLERIEQFTPQIGILLNLTPDHLDRYDSFNGYCNAKYRLFENQESHQFAILNADDRESRRRKFNYRSRQLYFALNEENLPGQSAEGVLLRGGTLLGRLAGKEFEIIAADKVSIPGEHNLANAAAAAAAALAIEISPEVIANAVQGFKGVEHRLEQVATVGGIDFVNDSKGTNVDSVLVALKSIPGKINLIAGGRDKGGDFTRLLVAAKDKVENIVVLGEASEKIFEQLGRHIPIVMARSMADAVDKAFELSHPGFTVLLSPGCASFDMYKNFEERGRDFKNLVRKMKNGKGSGTAVEV